VPRMLRSAVSGLRGVFDALWRCAAYPGSIGLLRRQHGPGSAEQREERCTASGNDVLRSLPQWLSVVRNGRVNRISRFSVTMRVKQALLRFHGNSHHRLRFTPRSSRYLILPFKFYRHGHPNKPANGSA